MGLQPDTVVPGDATRAADDAAATALTRHRLRQGPLRAIPADEVIGPMLEASELLVAVRHHAVVDWHPSGGAGRSIAGTLYLTSRRLVVAGEELAAWGLGHVREADVSDRQLLLVLGDGTGVALTIDRPASLRIKLQASRLGRVEG